MRTSLSHLASALVALASCSYAGTRAPSERARAASAIAEAHAAAPLAIAAEARPSSPRAVMATSMVTAPASSPPARVCGDAGWSTYAHDAARTSASDGCIDGPLRAAWTFAPAPFAGRSGRVHHAIAERGAIFAVGLRGQSPVLHRLDEDATPRWTFDSRADIHRAHWPSIALGSALVNDDGFYVIDLETGRHEGRGLDQWGNSLTDGERIYLTNTLQIEGPGLFVGAYTREGKPLWKQNKFFGAPQGFADDLGGLCLDGGVLFHAANYKFASHSSLTAYDAASGAKRWSVQVVPVSSPSTGDGKLVTVESPARDADRLVARHTSTGVVAWSQPVLAARGAAPVIAGPVVVVHAEAGVLAFDLTTGAPLWSAPIARKTCDVGAATSLAAAMGSETLVVTSGASVHVLSLADGSERWSGIARAGSDAHSPVIVGRTLYVVAGGQLVRLDDAGRD